MSQEDNILKIIGMLEASSLNTDIYEDNLRQAIGTEDIAQKQHMLRQALYTIRAIASDMASPLREFAEHQRSADVYEMETEQGLALLRLVTAELKALSSDQGAGSER